MKRHIVFIILIFTLFISQSLNAQFLHSDAGLLPNTPYCANHFITIENSGNIDDKIEAAIAEARGYSINDETTIIFFPEGIYSLSSPIVLDQPETDKNIIFQGEDSESTILKFTLGNSDDNCFIFRGVESETHITTLIQDVQYLYNNIVADDLSDIDVGDWFRLSEFDFPVNPPDLSWAEGCVGQVTQLEEKNGNLGIMRAVAARDYSTNTENTNLRIYEISPVLNLGIENLQIWRNDGGHGGTGTKGISVVIDHAINCWVKGVHFYQTCKHHIQVTSSAHIEVSGCYFHDARFFDGGYAYGVQLTGSTSLCMIENNIFHKLRHAMMVQAGANTNVFTFNYSYETHKTVNGIYVQYYLGDGNGDICVHGNYPFNNLFEHNWICLIVADRSHGDNGPDNWFIRNMVHDDHKDRSNNIRFFKSPDYGVGGCMNNISTASPVSSTESGGDNYWDVFGYIDGAYRGHNAFNPGSYLEELAFWGELSSYYTSKPDFVNSNFSWPSIGPRLAVEDDFLAISQDIPARIRFNSSIKTYLSDPTSTFTTNGTLEHDEYWSVPITLAGNVIVPDGITLTIVNGATVSLNNYYIKCEGTGKIINNGTVVGFTKNASQGSYYKGFFPSSTTIQQIINWATSGWNIHVTPGTYTEILDIKSGVSVIGSGAEQTILDGTGIPKSVFYSTVVIKFVSEKTVLQGFTVKNLDQNYNNPRGIIIHQGSGSENAEIRNCIVQTPYNKQGAGIVSHYSSAASIKECILNGNYYGIAFVGSPYGWITLSNDISGSYYGVYLTNSDPYMTRGDSPGAAQNFIHENEYGLYSTYHSEPQLGDDLGLGQNYFYCNLTYYDGYDLYATSDCDFIDADNNWWGENPPVGFQIYHEKGSSWIDYTPWEVSGPTCGSMVITESDNRLFKTASTEPIPDEKEESEAEKYNRMGRELMVENKFDEAIPYFEHVINEFPETETAEFSLDHMALCYHRLERIKELIDELTNLQQSEKTPLPLKEFATHLLAEEHWRQRNVEEALLLCTNSVTEKSSSEFERFMKLTEGMINKYELDNKSTASNIFENLIAEDKNDAVEQWAKIESLSIMEKDAPELNDSTSTDIYSNKITEYSLHNSPNPFNPDTEIEFILPEQTKVRLLIYNMLGQQIRTLLDEPRETGVYHMIWDGRNDSGIQVPSGIYICRMLTDKYIKTIKMSLMR